MRRHILDLIRWYITPVGALFGFFLVVAAVLGFIGYADWAFLTGIVAVGVVVPYKLARERRSGRALEAKIKDVEATALAKKEESFSKRDSDLRAAMIQEIERVDALTNARIDTIEHHLDKRFEELSTEVKGTIADISSEVRDMRHLQMESMTRVERAITSVDGVTDELQKVADDLAKRAKEIGSLRDDSASRIRELRNDLKDERNERIVGIARSVSRFETKGRLLLVLTPPRTGSTWLLDALRAHPDVHFEATPRALSILQLSNMNRYPSGLSNRENAELDVEVSPGRGARIPDYAVTVPPSEEAEPLSVEKIHPLFYDFDTSYFLERLRVAEREGSPVKLLVRLRDPEYTIRSILRYKQRDPGWYRFIPESDVPRHVERSLRSILEVVRVYPALLSRYEDHVRDPVTSMAQLYQAIWPDQPEDRQKEIALAVANSVTREKRANDGFLGEQPSEVDPGESSIDAIIDSDHELVERCRQLDAEIQAVISA